VALESLKTDTIYECAFELRFVATGNPSAADLLPGILFRALRAQFTASRQLPFATVPLALRQQANLRYMPTTVLEGKELSVAFGPNVMVVSMPRPYQGWQSVRGRIMECVHAAIEPGLIGNVERISLKYVNLLTLGRTPFDLGQLKVRLELDDLVAEGPVAIRSEIQRNDCIVVVDIVSGATVQVTRPQGESATGVILTVDAIKRGSFDNTFSQQLPGLLDTVHRTEKEVFFSLLADETLKQLGPSYGTAH